MAEPVGAWRRSDEESRWLQQIVRRGKHGSVRVRRALIIMASASGTPVRLAASVARDHEGRPIAEHPVLNGHVPVGPVPMIAPIGGSVRSGYVDAGSLNVTDSEGAMAPAQRWSSLDTELADWHPDPPDLCALWAGTWC
jgi:hypothetical protein